MEERENLEAILKKLEGVYKITIDSKQKERVKKDIKKIKLRLLKYDKYKETLQENEPIEKEEIIIEPIKEEEKKEIYEILGSFEVKKVHPASKDFELDMAATYMEIFENELWAALSDYHLKLDYYYSKEREKFYDKLENCRRLLKQYIDILEEYNKTTLESYKDKLRLMITKQARAFLIESVELMRDINEFLYKLLTDYENGGNIILNPNDKIIFSSIEGKKLLNEWRVIDGLRYILKFTEEYIKKIKIPEEIFSIKKGKH